MRKIHTYDIEYQNRYYKYTTKINCKGGAYLSGVRLKYKKGQKVYVNNVQLF